MSEMSNYRIARLLETVIRNQEIIMSGLDDLRNAVAKETSVEAAAVTLIQGLVNELRNAGSDTDLKALADQLTAATQPLANAVMANTTSAPAASGGTGTAAPGATGGTPYPAPAPAPAPAPVTGTTGPAASPGTATGPAASPPAGSAT